jgi:hypothetical protein
MKFNWLGSRFAGQKLSVQVSQILGPLEAYMVVNFRTREISRGMRKLTRTPTLIKKNFNMKFNIYFISTDNDYLSSSMSQLIHL